MTYVLGFTILYGIPAVLAGVFWCWPIRKLVAHWTGRDVMLGFIPKAVHVHHSEKLLGIKTRPTGRKMLHSVTWPPVKRDSNSNTT